MLIQRSSSITRSLLRNSIISSHISPNSPRCDVTCRRFIRLKPQSGPTASARYDRYLRVLTKQFDAAKKKRDEEEKRAAEPGRGPTKKEMKASAKEAESRAFDEENSYFWKTTLNDTQKALLKTFNINNFSELCEASDAAERQLRSPPYPDIGQLRPRLRHAYTIFHEALYQTETVSSED
ncbi:hypothetical protein BDZ89DRAFT_1061959 [Hymenopellis radicata]|nr:hypothetical protein BDZ89DRAFT_1061959 [Hymenopellis radicata]